MASEMVMAIGDSGRLEPTPVEDTVDIQSVPLGNGNVVVPETVRWFSSIRDGGCIPTSLRRVIKPSVRNRSPYVFVEFNCTKFLRYDSDNGPVFGDWSSCYVRNLSDANHPIFNGLNDRERNRIRRAVIAAQEA